MVMCNVDHVVSVDGAKRSQTVAHNGKESNKDAVDDVNDIYLLATNVDPAD